MRPLLLILLGIVIGALATANIVNALRQRDAYPRGLMSVMQHHLAGLRERASTTNCSSADVQTHLAVMHILANQIEGAVYAKQHVDAEFHGDVDRLRLALDAATSTTAAPNPCAALTAALVRVGDACDNCHRTFR